MLPWAFDPQLLVDEVLNFVLILMVVTGAALALLLLVSLMFASPVPNLTLAFIRRHLKGHSIKRRREHA